MGYPGNCFCFVAFRIRPDFTPAISRQTNAAGRRDFDIGSNQDRRQTFFSVFRRITPSSPFAASESLRLAETATARPGSRDLPVNLKLHEHLAHAGEYQ